MHVGPKPTLGSDPTDIVVRFTPEERDYFERRKITNKILELIDVYREGVANNAITVDVAVEYLTEKLKLVLLGSGVPTPEFIQEKVRQFSDYIKF